MPLLDATGAADTTLVMTVGTALVKVVGTTALEVMTTVVEPVGA